MIISTYLDAVYNSGGVPGLPGTIDDEIDPQTWFKKIRATRGIFRVTFDTNGVAMARHGSRICVYRATAPKKLLNTLRGFRDNVKNLKTVNTT